MDRKYFVYKHTNKVNGKVYIGITGQKTVESRWKNGLGYGKYNRSQTSHLYHAIKKYGWDNFDHEVIFSNLNKEDAERKEVELIAEYNSTNRAYGYNKEAGGFSGNPLSEDAKAKIGKANAGANNGMYKAGENHPMFGKTHSSDARAKLSVSHKGKPTWNKGLKGIYTEEQRRAISETHKGNKYNLGRVWTEEQREKASKNVSELWKCEDYKNHMSAAHMGVRCNCKKVHCNGIVFDSIVECSEHLGVHWKTVARWLKGVHKIPKKYIDFDIKYV